MTMATTSPWLAVAAGMLTVGAPCVLPMLPVVLGASVSGGSGAAQRTRPLFIALGFALSFAAVALLFSSFTQVLGVSQEGLRRFAAVMLLVFGVLTVWPRPFQWLSQHAGGVLSHMASLGMGSGGGNWGGLLLGLSLGAVWTPCAGPVLASILTLIATEPAGVGTAVLLLAYSTGAALPMLVIAYGGQAAATHVRRMARHAHRVQQVFGVVVIAVALAMLWEVDGQITAWLTQFYPSGWGGL
ncbi:cytochrome c biogenesis CcdA family protein [Acidovorax sp. LjRoot74]|uniref:cytochrome c biogenesis CcdA family protein n=1 Tax=Acidovorax sp. LjRoot74 TaxID=3342337 RepID=UPI003ED130C6